MTPSSSGYSSTSFPFCWAAQPGAMMADLSVGSGSHCFELQQLTPNSDIQLTQTSCSTGLYNCLTSTCFSERRICTQFNPSTVKVIPWYLRPDAPVIYTGAFLFWQLGRVGGQYVTTWYLWNVACSPHPAFVYIFSLSDRSVMSIKERINLKCLVRLGKTSTQPLEIPHS